MQNQPTSQNKLVLKPSEEKRLDDLFNFFAKTEPNVLKISEFFLFCLDRSLISPKIGFSHIYEQILDILGPIEEDEIVKPSQSQKERSINRKQFNAIIEQLSKWIYHAESNNLQRMYIDILTERTVANNDRVENNRNPISDDVTKKLLTEQAIAVLCQYEEELRACYVAYMTENYRKGSLLLKWEELAMDNKKLSTHAFARFLNDSQVVPHSMSPEQIQDVIHKILQPVNTKEQEFFQKSKVIEIFDKDLEKAKEVEYQGDPKMAFHEFLLILMRIAFEHYPKNEEKKNIEQLLERFFKQVLGFRKNHELETEDFPNINKKVYEKLNNYYQDLEEDEKQYDEEYNQEEEDEDLQDPLQMLAQMQNQEIFNGEPLSFEIGEIILQMRKDLPPLPPLPQVEQENPPPYRNDPLSKPKKKKQLPKKERVVIGDKLPLPPEDKTKAQKPKPPKKKQLKKGEKPPRKIIFGGFPGEDPGLQYDHLKNMHDDMVYGEKQLGDINRGTMSKIDVLPVIIDEILYPPECLDKIRYLVEAAINSYNQSNFIFALKNFEEAKNKWQDELGKELPDNILLFFEYSKASIYSSAGRDDYALYWYMQSKSISDRLPYTNPDRSLAYCGLGSTFFNMEEYNLACRSYLKAREVREKLMGVEHVDTATIYNNLGCCMFMLNRNKEAVAYLKIAHSILDLINFFTPINQIIN
ncbi:hypothetical protein PPERSA_03451 [Pseudocohnilembus persalinus]|uniref:Tetratricopeptide repeat n=1 Tax=Pseudocohnilembus persalinus TaxID=266149 RepID=A0A0V0QBV0_PSEPJ|nr:hypothetical protein PPERSA_03451 [Pseudocohnilembus persalinus]|eukprot:KRW99650.1 hypothetical protein PPERSA_03451 [Pseudocohnilembus persalinus]